MNKRLKFAASGLLLCLCTAVSAQKYQGVIDKTVAIVGGEMISLSEVEAQVQAMRVQGYSSDRNLRCEILENLMQTKLLISQARVDSLVVNQDQVTAQLEQYTAQTLTMAGGQDELEEYFGKPLYKLRQEWRDQIEEQTLAQQEQMEISKNLPDLTQICVYPDREAAATAVKERLLSIRERIIGGERFATLARLYSEDPGSSRKGGELGMASKTIFWPAFSDAAMSLKPGTVSQIVETPDGFHIIEVLEKRGDMFNARHILLKPSYTAEDQQKAFDAGKRMAESIG